MSSTPSPHDDERGGGEAIRKTPAQGAPPARAVRVSPSIIEGAYRHVPLLAVNLEFRGACKDRRRSPMRATAFPPSPNLLALRFAGKD